MSQTIGSAIIDAVIAGRLLRAECAHDKGHGCVLVWSGNADEQITEMVNHHELPPYTTRATAYAIKATFGAAHRSPGEQMDHLASVIQEAIEEAIKERDQA